MEPTAQNTHAPPTSEKVRRNVLCAPRPKTRCHRILAGALPVLAAFSATVRLEPARALTAFGQVLTSTVRSVLGGARPAS
jgi:hypothetical protein